MWLRKLREIRDNPLQLLDSLPEAALQVKEFRRSKIEDGRKVWEIAGQEARYVSAEKEVVIQKPSFSYYDKKGEILEAKAEEGHIYLAGQEIDRMELLGEIRIGYQGFILETDKVLYLKEENKVLLPGKVTLKGDGMELEGVGMEIALQEEKLRLQNSVKTRINPGRLRGREKSHDRGEKKS